MCFDRNRALAQTKLCNLVAVEDAKSQNRPPRNAFEHTSLYTGGVLDAGNPTIIPGTDSVWTRLLAFLQNPRSDDDKEDEYPDQWSLADSSWAFSDEQTAESEAPSDTTRQGSANEHESIASQYRSTPPPYSIEDEGDDGNDLDMSDTPRQSTTRHGALSLRSSSSYAVPTKRDTEYSSGEQSSESDYIVGPKEREQDSKGKGAV
ncbi:hypothetical protein OHC33_009735 [Knufia fluminis]|uniref:Uncharacterized protein n=1 Tax=Knufia fluminis TaxID=191047 RepID=A0AAN8E8Y4_9EURO|nr:hypothetical protein OHC33_009735 [Knufia fluminis]